MNESKTCGLPNEKQRLVYAIRCHLGRESAITIARLSNLLGIKERRLREMVHDLRREGTQIGLTTRAPYGYYWISDGAELNETLSYFEKLGRENFGTAAALRNNFQAEFKGQLRLGV
jgi:hypothetical protein